MNESSILLRLIGTRVVLLSIDSMQVVMVGWMMSMTNVAGVVAAITCSGIMLNHVHATCARLM
jgi:hypothetical protein